MRALPDRYGSRGGAVSAKPELCNPLSKTLSEALISSATVILGSKDQGTKEVGVAKHTVSYTASQRLNHRRTYVPYRLAEGESR